MEISRGSFFQKSFVKQTFLRKNGGCINNLLRGSEVVSRLPASVPHKTPGSSNGRTVAFEAINLRSNRRPGVLCGIATNLGPFCPSEAKGEGGSPGPAEILR